MQDFNLNSVMAFRMTPLALISTRDIRKKNRKSKKLIYYVIFPQILWVVFREPVIYTVYVYIFYKSMEQYKKP